MLHTLNLASLDPGERPGLPPVALRELQRLVLLAGPNGGGKTRLLRAVAHACRQANNRRNIENELQSLRAHSSATRDSVPEGIAERERQLRDHSRYWDSIRRSTVIDLPPLVVPPAGNRAFQVNLEAWRGDLRLNAANAFNTINSYFHCVAQALYNKEHPRHANDPNTIRDAERALYIVQDLNKWLGFQVGYVMHKMQPVPTLDGVNPMNLDLLSPGEYALLSGFIVIETRLAMPPSPPQNTVPLVVLIDELENHLHPSAAVETLRRLLNYLGDRGQIWLATHNPAIVAAFAGEASIYYVQRHSIDYASSNLTKALDGLVGGEDARRHLRDMLDEADSVAFYKFAGESLQDAIVAGVAEKPDEQSRQLASLLQQRVQQGRKMRVLDYGAGRGRFAAELARCLTEETRAHIEYFAYQHPRFDTEEQKKERIDNLGQLVPAAQATASTSSELSDFMNERRVDLAILCNVMHEIEPSAWLSTLEDIGRILTDDGYLLIMEDQEMPVGELPNSTGFIVLDLPELRELFGSTEDVMPLESNRGRCSAVLVKKSRLIGLSDAGRQRLSSTLKQAAKRVIRTIEEIRQSSGHSHSKGRQHARSALMLANLTLARQKLGEAI